MAVGELRHATVRAWLHFFLGLTLPERPYVPAKALVTLLEELGYESGAVRVTLSRMHDEGQVERRRTGRETGYRLLPEWVENVVHVEERLARFGQHLDWDGTWTFLLTSVPDELRALRSQLTTQLSVLGFGRLRESAWCAANDYEVELKHLIEQLDIAPFVDVIVGRPSMSMDADELIRRCWDLDRLRGEYRVLARRFGPYGDATRVGRLSDADALRWWVRLVHDFRALVFSDPDLPPDALPPETRKLRDKAIRVHRAADEVLAARAVPQVLDRFRA